MRVAELRQAYARAAAALHLTRSIVQPLPRLRVPSPLRLWAERLNPFSHSLTWSRRPLHRFWQACAANLKRGRLHHVDVNALVFNSLQELALFTTFAFSFFSRLLTRLFARTVVGA